ncbi:MAG TPA: hypothetical protein DD734_09680 [Firmicutes bacterium]|jgi:hypothetical protein|nr:hypothetical protein [Bacillota bacterium]HBR34893.1 hypothetical protein [Bacillota bacterium]
MAAYPLFLIYPLYTGVLVLLALALIPKKDLRTLFHWGVLYGGVLDVVIFLLITDLFGIGGYKNYGPFSYLGIPFFPPLAWTSYFILYLYLLPSTKPWNYIFTVTTAVYNMIFSNVLMNLGIYEWTFSRLILPFFLYLLWNLLVTWTYQKFIVPATA